jgi:hypothetical protein
LRKGDYRRRKRRRSIKTPSPGRSSTSAGEIFLTTGLPQGPTIRTIAPWSLQIILLSDVNLLFLVHMAQEQEQRASAKNYRQHDGNYAIPHPMSVLANEPEEENVNATTQ